MSSSVPERVYCPLPLPTRSSSWRIKTQKISCSKGKSEGTSLIGSSNKTPSSSATGLMLVTLISVYSTKIWLNKLKTSASFKSLPKYNKSSKSQKWSVYANTCVDRHLISQSEVSWKPIVKEIFLLHVVTTGVITIHIWIPSFSNKKGGLLKKPKPCSRCQVGERWPINLPKTMLHWKRCMSCWGFIS